MKYKQAQKAYKAVMEAKVSRPARKPDLSGYSVPTSTVAKFKEGDIVAVHFMNYYGMDLQQAFRMYHPQLAVPYMNGVGTVRLFQQFSMSSKYGVEFEDGNIIPISSKSLVGPFVSIEAAKKYAGKNGQTISIDPQDLKGFVPDSAVEKSAVIEDEFKKSFCNSQVGFKWLDTPVIIKYKNYNVYVLASKKNTVSTTGAEDTYAVGRLHFVNDEDRYDRLDNPTRSEFNNSFVFIKVIDRETLKLQKTSAISSNSSSSCYFLQRPVLSKYPNNKAFKDGLLVKPLGIYNIDMLPVGSGLSKTAKRIKKDFDVFDNGLIKTGYEYFKNMYDLEEGQTTIKANANHHMVEMSENVLGKHFKDIGKYTVIGDCEVKYKSGASSFQYVPAKVVGDYFFVGGEDATNCKFQSMDGLSKCDVSQVKAINIQSELATLNNFPEGFNRKDLEVRFRRAVDCLVGIPDKLICSTDFENIKSFKGAQNCEIEGPIAASSSTTSFEGFFKSLGTSYRFWDLSHDLIERHLKYRDLVNRVPELDGIF
jgi:hypothetical protein